MVLHGESLVFITTAIVATVAEAEMGSTFHETCLKTELKKVSRNRPCYTVQRLLKLFFFPRNNFIIITIITTPAETCFVAPLHVSFS